MEQKPFGVCTLKNNHVLKQRDIVLVYLAHWKVVAANIVANDHKEMVAAGNLVLGGLTTQAWTEVLSGKTLDSLRSVRDVFQKTVAQLELAEAQRLMQEETLKRIYEEEALLEQEQLLEQQKLESTAYNKRLREEDGDGYNDLHATKRPRPEHQDPKLDFSKLSEMPQTPQTPSVTKPTTPNLKYYLLDATPPRTELRKLAEPLMPKATPDETGPPQTRSQTRAQLDPAETASGLLPIVKIMLQNLHTAGIDHLIARPTSLHGSSNTSVLLKCRRVNSLQQAAAAREETEREALLAEVLRQKEELKKIKLEPED